MPELPEVETIRLGLQKYLIGHRIEKVDVKVSKIFQGDPKNVIGAKVMSINRVGKGLIIELNNDYVLAIHLKLTGQIIYHGKETVDIHLSDKTGGKLPSKYTHIIFTLDKGAFLYYNDLRKFGWIKIVQNSKLKVQSYFKDLGPEPPVTNSSKNNLTIKQFNNIISKSNIPIKVLLMNQKKISGIGNIYANEALFLAGINPKRKTKALSDKEINKLYDSIIEVLKRGLKYGGSSDVNFVNALGEDGNYQNHFLVYGRKGEKCLNCGEKVEKIQLGGRGTYFCPECQK
ncbi:MAG: bifunctional DNA-formamidopyrimidine glycosylase/DNA-(apurinic or apyrimidinic site) lyase [Candidatus Levybacteria bacterium]|nr:bifunctional DNA-formamidopyrimidine glycosylase/DNA-(apurinic or apyrimidinic site) lyase [Candidatus Levybacteria bacterium]